MSRYGNLIYALVCLYLDIAAAPVEAMQDPVPVEKVDMNPYGQWMRGSEPVHRE